MILVKAVLQQLAVYWAHLFILPKKILNDIRILMEKFIWGGGREKKTIHLAKWDSLAIPIENGGWGILDMDIFGKSLIIKSLW